MWFGGSNVQWLNRLDAKDAQLRGLQESFMHHLAAKDAELRDLNKALVGSLKENGDLKSSNTQLRNDLKAANDKLLDHLGKRNLRGAVEFITSTHLTGTVNKNNGVQPKLNTLDNHQPFKDTLDNISRAQQLRIPDMFMCLKQLYHTLSKEMHGSVPGLVTHTDSFAPCEVGVLVALFELYNLSYEVRDQEGNVVQYHTKPQAGP